MTSILISHEDETYKRACELVKKWEGSNLIRSFNLEELGLTVHFYSEFDKNLFKATL